MNWPSDREQARREASRSKAVKTQFGCLVAARICRARVNEPRL